mmetsp:Transcript_7106/g.19102  ORF Transcript_7106/g.19102 Transcript_7106/m.19102 type:complete len:90 (+) Transcript_7106:2085-2354(+)
MDEGQQRHQEVLQVPAAMWLWSCKDSFGMGAAEKLERLGCTTVQQDVQHRPAVIQWPVEIDGAKLVQLGTKNQHPPPSSLDAINCLVIA